MARAKEMTAVSQKCNRGPGGWRCGCCRFGSLAWMKKHMGRIVRRKLKQSDRHSARVLAD